MYDFILSIVLGLGLSLFLHFLNLITFDRKLQHLNDFSSYINF